MDEKGFMKGVGDGSKVIIPSSEMEAFSVQLGNREWVSVIECIGTNGYYLPGFVIFKGKQIQENWIPNAGVDKETVLNVSENGWTDSEIALDWIKHFDTHTKIRTQGKYRLLDGHTSHVSLPFVEYCEANKIVSICFPPHSTHVLQPLDVGVFSPFAKAYKTQIQRQRCSGLRELRMNNSCNTTIRQERKPFRQRILKVLGEQRP
jgi:DDE superfamily endonuclease